MVLANLITGFIIILIGASLIPSLADSIHTTLYTSHNGANRSNVTGASAAAISMLMLFFSIGVMAAGVAVAVNGLKQSGMM